MIGTNPSFNPLLGVVALFAVGVSVLLSLRLIYGGNRAGDGMYLWLRVFAYVLLLLAWMVLLIFGGGVLGFVLWLASLVVFGMAVNRYHALRQATLMQLLAISVERQMPLAPLLSAFADEQSGRFEARLRRLVELLNVGCPLADALDEVPRLVPRQAAALARVGQRSGDVAVALEQAVPAARISAPHDDTGADRLSYIAVLMIVFVFIVTFFSIKILPAFQKIFEDFGTDLPAMTQVMIAVVQLFAASGIAAFAFLAAALLLPYVVLQYMGWLKWQPPLFDRWTRRLDAATVLRALSLPAARGQPLEGALQTLASHFPRARIRARLHRVLLEMQSGREWTESFVAHGLLARRDAALLRSAQRVGNLSWALTETAGSVQRQVAYRREILSQALFPLVILMMGMLLGFFVIACFMPLVKLINDLT